MLDRHETHVYMYQIYSKHISLYYFNDRLSLLRLLSKFSEDFLFIFFSECSNNENFLNNLTAELAANTNHIFYKHFI